jgi:hypothetical protein
MRLSQSFSFWESNLRFMGKCGLLAAFPRAFYKTNRVLGNALYTYDKMMHELAEHYKFKTNLL